MSNSNDQIERLADKWLGDKMTPFHKHLEFAIVEAPLDWTLSNFGAWISIEWGNVSVFDGDPSCASYPASDFDKKQPTRHVSRHRTWGAVLSTPVGQANLTVVETKLFKSFDVFSVVFPKVRIVRLYSHFNVHNSKSKDYQHGMIASQNGAQRVVDLHYGAGPPGDPWRFFEQGPVQEFETPQNYEAKRKADRVTRDHVVAWASALGVDVYQHVLAGNFERTVRLHPNPTQGYKIAPDAAFLFERESMIKAGVQRAAIADLAVDKKFGQFW